MLWLLRKESSKYFLNFTLLTAADVNHLKSVSRRYARSLAETILGQRQQYEALFDEYPVKEIAKETIAYLVIGCFALDWDGLDLTAQKGYRTASSRIRPGDNRYTPWAYENTPGVLQGLYWGSHSNYFEDVAITTFGDHHATPRMGLPDVIWRMDNGVRQAALPESIRHAAEILKPADWDDESEALGHLMLASRAGRAIDASAQQQAFLESINYVQRVADRHHASVPVFSSVDKDWIMEARQLTWRVMDTWLAENYESAQAELNDLTPIKHGVPYEIVFTQIWHYLFGTANQILVEEGFFSDPYAENRRFKGFISMVWDPSLAPLQSVESEVAQ